MPDSDSNAYKPQQSVPSLDPNPNNLLNADEKKNGTTLAHWLTNQLATHKQVRTHMNLQSG